MKVSNDYFYYHKTVLRWVGISLEERESCCYKIYSKLVLCLIFTGPIITFAEVIAPNVDFDYRINALVYVIGCCTAVGTTSALYYNRFELGDVFNSLQQGVFVPDVKRGGVLEEKLVQNCVKQCNKQNIIVYGLLFPSLLVVMTPTLVKRILSNDYHNWDMPFVPFSIFDITYSPVFELVWIWQSILYVVNGLAFIVGDLILITYTSHITIQCKLLENCFKRVLELTYQEIEEDIDMNENILPIEEYRNHPEKIPWKYLQITLKKLVIYHSSIIDVANRYEAVYNLVILVHQLGILLCLCGVIFHGTSRETIDFQFLRDLGTVICFTFETMLLSYWANEVIEESQKIGTVCFQNNFAGTDIRFQKGCALLIQRSQRPIVFTVGKLAPLSLMMSVGTLKAVISYFMVLRSVKENI